jgi:CubicO group peptidase (beta-lactamase class C family)
VRRRLSGGVFLAVVIAASCAWLIFYAHGELAREANRRMERQVEKGFFSGAVLISRNGSVLFEQAYGMSDKEAKTPNTLETRFRVGSISKTFTAILVMQLEAEHRLALTDGICNYLDECPSGWNAITLHHLLSHTSGIFNYTRTKRGEPLPTPESLSTPHTRADVFNRMSHEPLAFAPGERFDYSNSNYWLLSRVIEKVTGQSYEEALRRRILEPAGMHDSGLVHDWPNLPHAAVGYWMTREGKIVRAPVVDGSMSSGDGGIYSTVADLQGFSDALDRNELISRATLERMRTPVKGAYGYGWEVPPVSRYTLDRHQVSHGGAVPGFLSQFQRFEDEKLTLIVLSNNDRSDPTQVARAIGSAVFAEPFTATFERGSVEVPEALLQRYVGEYEIDDEVFRMYLREGHLYAQNEDGNGPEIPLIAESDSLFFIKGTDSNVSFAENTKGEVVGLTVQIRDDVRYVKKVR